MSDQKLIDFSSFDFSKIGEKPKSTKNKFKKLSFLGNVKEGEISSKDMVNALFQRFHNHRYIINNAYIFEWESDFFTVTESDYLYEIEIKISKGDFRDDFDKAGKHSLLEGKKNDDTCHKMPNKFFYAAPKGLLEEHEIPKYAGFIEVGPTLSDVNIVKDAPFLHKHNLLALYKDILLAKFAWRYKDDLLKNYENSLKNLENSEEKT